MHRPPPDHRPPDHRHPDPRGWDRPPVPAAGGPPPARGIVERVRRRGVLIAALVGSLLLLTATVALVPEDPAPGSGPPLAGPGSLPAAPPTPDALRPYTAGSESAPLHLVEYGDFRCPSCLDMLEDDVVAVLERWIAAGRLRLTWRDFAILGPDSGRAARAAYAAAEQGRFWPMHRELFRAFASGSPRLTADGFERIARDAGVPDPARFRRDADSGAAYRFVARSYAVSAKRGVQAVPTFAVDGRRVRSGSMTPAQLERLLRRLWDRLDPGTAPRPADAPAGLSASRDVERDGAADDREPAGGRAAGAVAE